MRRAPDAYGFVGAGEITAAIVKGLHADVDDPPEIFLSPRGERTAHELANRFPGVHVCDSNQDVLDNATTIVLAVRPPIARNLLEELSFQPHQVLMSAVAGVQLERLRGWAEQAGHIVRVIPLPQATHRQSLTAVYPDNTAARDLFDRVGGVVIPDDERAFEALSAVTATFAAHLDYLATIARWATDHGVDPRAATAYTTHIFGQLGQSLLCGNDPLVELTAKHTTPGGNNEQFMKDLRQDGFPDTVRRALDRILTHLSR